MPRLLIQGGEKDEGLGPSRGGGENTVDGGSDPLGMDAESISRVGTGDPRLYRVIRVTLGFIAFACGAAFQRALMLVRASLDRVTGGRRLYSPCVVLVHFTHGGAGGRRLCSVAIVYKVIKTVQPKRAVLSRSLSQHTFGSVSKSGVNGGSW